MKYLSLIIICFAFIFSGFICAKSTGNSEGSPLPDKRPDDIRFRYSQSGGMMYYSEEIFISKDSSYYSINDGGAITKAYFKMSSQELDKLYSVFKDNNFDEIDSYEEKVYDRGGESIYLNWDRSKYAHVSNSGMSFIKDSWKSEWTACSNAIENIGKDEIEKQKKDYSIIMDNSLFGKEFYMQINLKVVVPLSTLLAERDSDKEIVRTIKLSPGNHRAIVTLGKATYNIPINADSTKTLRMYLANDSLKHEFIK